MPLSPPTLHLNQKITKYNMTSALDDAYKTQLDLCKFNKFESYSAQYKGI